MHRVIQIALIAVGTTLCAQEKASGELPQVTVTGLSNPVEKSCRKVIRGVDYFEQARTALAPDASLRIKLLPQKRETYIDHIVGKFIGTTFACAETMPSRWREIARRCRKTPSCRPIASL